MNRAWLQLLERLGTWLASKGRAIELRNSENDGGLVRHFLLWEDEYVHPLSLTVLHGHPRWFPFNAFLHRWLRSDTGLPHTHPRWTITIVLAGELWEITDRNRLRILKPGSIVIRRPSEAHTLFVPPLYAGKTWTLFIVGRRRYAQYYVMPDGTRVAAAMYTAKRETTDFFNTGFSGESLLPFADAEPNRDSETMIRPWLKRCEDQLLESEKQS